MNKDDGVRFHAILQKADGSTCTRETDDRRLLLTWIELHQQPGDTVIEVGTTASGAAGRNMLAAIALGAANAARGEQQ